MATLSATLSTCATCRQPLPIRPRIGKEKGVVYACKKCGTAYRAVILADADASCLANVVQLPPGATSLELGGTSSQALSEFAERPLPQRAPIECRVQTRMTREIDDQLQSGKHTTFRIEGRPFFHSVNDHGVASYDEKTEEEVVNHIGAATDQVDTMINALEAGKSVDGNIHEEITRDNLVQATKDLDLFVRLGIQPIGQGYPGRHSLHVSMLAAAIGARMGLDQESLVQLGVGCMIHDLGMIRVPGKVYYSPNVLNDADFGRVSAHPLHTFDLIQEHLATVPLVSRMVAYQMHERMDGSGYPRKRSSPMIHQAAKIAAVADVYMALVSPRPHRAAMLPYRAVEYLLIGVKQKIFDAKVVRALLNTVSLFPIGSFVQLSDDRIGRVIRTRSRDYCRPVVECWQPGNMDASPTIVDLATTANCEVTKALPSLAA